MESLTESELITLSKKNYKKTVIEIEAENLALKEKIKIYEMVLDNKFNDGNEEETEATSDILYVDNGYNINEQTKEKYRNKKNIFYEFVKQDIKRMNELYKSNNKTTKYRPPKTIKEYFKILFNAIKCDDYMMNNGRIINELYNILHE